MGLSGSFALPVGRGSCRAVTLPCLIGVPSVATKKAGNSLLDSTGHWPPPGDSPGGTWSAPGADKDWPFGRDGLALPFGESPVPPTPNLSSVRKGSTKA
jgi:hypothetical protein